MVFADACRRAAADSIIAIVPYFGYSRADSSQRQREPITASMVADLFQTFVIDRVIIASKDSVTVWLEMEFALKIEFTTDH
jgi:ribose-phosphate pyrophosphokinase